jgi:arylsulfatase A-like enzyme
VRSLYDPSPRALTRAEFRLATILAPFVVYDVGLLAHRLITHPELLANEGRLLGLRDAVALLASTLLFHAGLCLLGLAVVLRAQGRGRALGALAAIQASSCFITLLGTAAHLYFVRTGGTLDWPMVAYALQRPEELGLVAAGETAGFHFALPSAITAGALAAPWALPLLFPLWNHAALSQSVRLPVALASLGVVLCLLGFAPHPQAAMMAEHARDPVLHLVSTALNRPPELERLSVADASEMSDPLWLHLRPIDAAARPPNLVFVILESTRASAVTPFAPGLDSTPFLAALAKKSLVAERFHAVAPLTSKALIAVLCGIEPPHSLGARPHELGMLWRCLPRLLHEQGYASAMMQTAAAIDNRTEVAEAMGFDEFIGHERLPTDGFERANYLGYEDEAMVKPALRWAEEHRDRPFFLTLLTVNAHDRCLPLTRHGSAMYSRDIGLNQYLNAVHYDDVMLEKLFAGFRKHGLYENTIFVIVADHGEGFGEHGRYTHLDVPYEEGLHIPLLIHDPTGQRVRPGVLRRLSNQLDIKPTVADALGFEVAHGRFLGYSLLKPSVEHGVKAACANQNHCAALLRGTKKFIHHYGRRPDELFDLAEDPLERNNLAASRPTSAKQMLTELQEWDRWVDSLYYLNELRSKAQQQAAVGNP